MEKADSSHIYQLWKAFRRIRNQTAAQMPFNCSSRHSKHFSTKYQTVPIKPLMM